MKTRSMFQWFKKVSVAPSPLPPQVRDTVQYLIARQDLNMSPGKMAAQCAHASSSIVLAHFGQARKIFHGDKMALHQEAFTQWQERSFAKVVLRVKSRDQLIQLCQKLDELALPYAPIFDACRTELVPEEPNGSVLTCIGITPLFKDSVPKCLQKLQVYH